MVAKNALTAIDHDPVCFDSGCRRDSTVALRYRAVRLAIETMRECFVEPLSLRDMADAAQLSPFHFNRVFKSMIGVQPSVFLAAVRLEQAKKQLLTTQGTVTEICFDVGYCSLGTFTTRFTQLVGIPPTHLRQLANEPIINAYPHELYTMLKHTRFCQQTLTRPQVSGIVKLTEAFTGLIFVGMFADPLPQGQPYACTILTAPGEFHLSDVPDGQYYLFAAGMHSRQNLMDMLYEGAKLHGGIGKHPLTISHGKLQDEPITLQLRRGSWADPPTLVALPWFFTSELTKSKALLLS